MKAGLLSTKAWLRGPFVRNQIRTTKCLKRLQKRSIDDNLRQSVLIKQDRVQGFRLRPEAGRFVRSFPIPCPVLWNQYLRVFFIFLLLPFFTWTSAYQAEYFTGFHFQFKRNWSDHFVITPAWPSLKRNFQAKHTTRVGRTLFICLRNEQNKRFFFSRRPIANKVSFGRVGMRMTVMIRPVVLTFINRKVKADKDYNLSYFTSFLEVNQNINSQW